ncbi:dethiobiotin synthase [Allohahella marinimesophila]|uniref:ATP-dependent dethiobiotin synthetase BioD n=1 Tax=Allohahella marinimesophila TaxID=1054972 RepID=A0ABP7PNV5_9GAMM
MTYRFFVTGTDTDVGKTFVGCALLTHAAGKGLSTLGLKPVAAGCERTPEGLRNDDALKLQAASTTAVEYGDINPVQLEDAIAPHIAAQRGGQHEQLQVGSLKAHVERVLTEQQPDFAIVEGAGGWLVPLSSTAGQTETFADLAVALDYPVILVVALRLGCINHALLSCEAIRARGLKLAGWVANRPTAAVMAAEAENLATLKELLHAPLLGTLNFSEDAPEADRAVKAAANLSGLL